MRRTRTGGLGCSSSGTRRPRPGSSRTSTWKVDPEMRAARLADIPAQVRAWTPAGTPGLFVLDPDREAGG
jgi:hypothetical protein